LINGRIVRARNGCRSVVVGHSVEIIHVGRPMLPSVVDVIGTTAVNPNDRRIRRGSSEETAKNQPREQEDAPETARSTIALLPPMRKNQSIWLNPGEGE
jgi:hypothetical protein